MATSRQLKSRRSAEFVEQPHESPRDVAEADERQIASSGIASMLR